MAQNDILKRYLDAGLAFTALTQSRAEALVKDLVSAGEVQAEQARDAVTDLVERSRKNTERLVETIRQEVRAQITNLGLADKSDLDKLEARISKLFGSAAGPAKAAAKTTTSTARKAAATATPAKKAAAKKSPAKKSGAAKKTTAKKSAAKKAPAKKQG
jgi:polyhydroxyalkanoate synthesis regulator phasin